MRTLITILLLLSAACEGAVTFSSDTSGSIPVWTMLDVSGTPIVNHNSLPQWAGGYQFVLQHGGRFITCVDTRVGGWGGDPGCPRLAWDSLRCTTAADALRFFRTHLNVPIATRPRNAIDYYMFSCDGTTDERWVLTGVPDPKPSASCAISDGSISIAAASGTPVRGGTALDIACTDNADIRISLGNNGDVVLQPRGELSLVLDHGGPEIILRGVRSTSVTVSTNGANSIFPAGTYTGSVVATLEML